MSAYCAAQLNICKIARINADPFGQLPAGHFYSFTRLLNICSEGFKSRAIFYIRHITSPYYILLFIGCAGNDVICVLGSFYNSFSEKNCRMEAAGVTEELKARDPMRWVGLMNTLKAQAEEIIQDELIYK